MKDLVGIGVADAAEEVGVGQRPLERVVALGEDRGEALEVHVKDLNPAGIELRERVLAVDDVQ